MIASALPAIGAGAGLGIGAFELSRRAGLTPRATAAMLAAAGLAGSMLAPKGPLQSVATTALGLGAGFFALDLWNDRASHAGANKAAAAAQGTQRQAAGYVTRDEVQDAVRRELGQYHEALAAQIADLRNSFSSSRERYDDDERNAEPVHTEVFYGDERNAHAWDDDERNAEPVHTEVFHGDHGEERNAHAWDIDDAA